MPAILIMWHFFAKIASIILLAFEKNVVNGKMLVPFGEWQRMTLTFRSFISSATHLHLSIIYLNTSTLSEQFTAWAFSNTKAWGTDLAYGPFTQDAS